MRLIGIDYGERRVGIALSDDKGMMAFPHSVVPNDKDLIKAILDIAAQNNAEVVVVGESKNYKGEPNRIMEKVRPFGDELRAAGMNVVFEPELLTSHQAAHFQGKHGMLDAAAASIILQSYIDRAKSE